MVNYSTEQMIIQGNEVAGNSGFDALTNRWDSHAMKHTRAKSQASKIINIFLVKACICTNGRKLKCPYSSVPQKFIV